MKVQVKNFSTHQTAKVFAMLMTISTLFLMVPIGLMSMLMPASQISFIQFGIMFLIMPFFAMFQGVMGYIMMRIGTWFYNKITPHVGGIEFEFEGIDS